jgi:demethylmenaquinone methyltransferase/2-methoxy-6-polyprenyl-1,4-benzoquinol methylase
VGLGREGYPQRLAFERLAPKRGDTVLDLACGTDVNSSDLLTHVGPSGRIIAVDYSDGMLDPARAEARNNGWRNIEFIQADAAALSLPQSLDGVLCTFGLSAMPGERQALLRIAGSLKSGARFVSLDAKAFTGAPSFLNHVFGSHF